MRRRRFFLITEDALVKACKIYFSLVKHGHISSRNWREQIQTYDLETEVRKTVDILARESGTAVMRYEDGLYLFVQSPASVFDFTNEELRAALKLKDNLELYVCYYIMLCIIACFFSGDYNYVTLGRRAISIEDIVRFADEKTDNLLKREDLVSFSEHSEHCFNEVAQYWRKLHALDTRIEAVLMSRNSKIALVRRVIEFLEDKGYLYNERDYVIRVTSRLISLMRVYYANDNRKNQLLDYLMGNSQGVKN